LSAAVSVGPLSVGIVCYPTFGGSGVIATEVGLGMARRGHDVHIFAYDRPARLSEIGPLDEPVHLGDGTLSFHKVDVVDYPVFHQPPYALALASRIVDVAIRHGLDLIHVHYAVPHATSAFLAREILASCEHNKAPLPKLLTTLHGTDITLVGSDPTYRPITRVSILKSDAVTAPSVSLMHETRTRFDLPNLPIEVIPNFVDTNRFVPRRHPDRPPTLIHVSNFRPVKRIDDLISIFEIIALESDARLVLVGDGPELAPAERRLRIAGLRDRVVMHGHRHEVADLLADADVFILPSSQESFGVAALEAMACGIPVVASDVGGLPEVITHGESGFLVPVGDIAGFATHALTLLDSPERARSMGALAREVAVSRFGMEVALDRYESLYRRMCG
jgi:N-acetyl-alpha-D-glucosaminyl L-malate synthase BshA